jgi:two-component system NtrC family sensor kinase
MHRDGSTLHIEVSMKAVRDDGGRVVKYRGVARDVTERVHLQTQLIQSAKLSGIGQMISGVAHELNNPLTTVMGYSQLLQASDVDETIKEDLRRIYDDALRAQRIVQNLLTFARQKRPQRGPVDINEVIEQTLSLRKYQLRVDNVEVVTELAENLPWTVADGDQLQQVLLNIINNAHQAVSQQRGGGILTIRSELVDGDTIRVTLADTGPGMPPQVLKRIFDPFFTTKDVGAGTGLGLSVSHGIIQEHGGRIWAESERGQGATFFVELPVRTWMQEDSVFVGGE